MVSKNQSICFHTIYIYLINSNIIKKKLRWSDGREKRSEVVFFFFRWDEVSLEKRKKEKCKCRMRCVMCSVKFLNKGEVSWEKYYYITVFWFVMIDSSYSYVDLRRGLWLPVLRMQGIIRVRCRRLNQNVTRGLIIGRRVEAAVFAQRWICLTLWLEFSVTRTMGSTFWRESNPIFGIYGNTKLNGLRDIIVELFCLSTT